MACGGAGGRGQGCVPGMRRRSWPRRRDSADLQAQWSAERRWEPCRGQARRAVGTNHGALELRQECIVSCDAGEPEELSQQGSPRGRSPGGLAG